MVSFITDPEAIAALDEKEKNRAIAMLMSLKLGKGDDNDFKIDWAQAAVRFGAGSAESMRVNSRKVLNKIKIGEGEDGSATPKATTSDDKTDETGEKTPTKPKTPRKPRTPKAKKEDAEDDAADAPSTTKKSATKRKSDDDGEKPAIAKKTRTPRKKAAKSSETVEDEAMVDSSNAEPSNVEPELKNEEDEIGKSTSISARRTLLLTFDQISDDLAASHHPT